MKNALLSYFELERENIIETFNYLHSVPEIGFQEYKTSEYLAERLTSMGYSVKTKIGGTGVIGILDSGKPGPCIGLRSDMDALPHEIDGELSYIHSCGHDANMTIVLSVAEALSRLKLPQKGQLRIIFQPAEETLLGAKAMLESKEMEGLDYLIGTHLRPREELPYGKISPSIRHGASGIMEVSVTGSEAHGARPHQGVNSIDVCALIIAAANSIRLDPQVPHSLKVTKIRGGGSALNVIPGKAEMAFDMRAQTNSVMKQLKELFKNSAEKIGESCGANVVCHLKGEVPAATDSDEVVKIAKDCITYVLGEKGLSDYVVTSGGEDFHNYSYEMKNLKTTILGIGADLIPGLHKPDMKFNLQALIEGSKVMALMVNEILK
ncbi:MAG: amidohydrolase [Clostridiales bacterium]|nr:amidohydrolase [Clostridiales bacterium]